MGNFLSVSHGPMTAFGGLGFRRLREKQELMPALLHKGMHTRIDLRTTAAVISALRLGEIPGVIHTFLFQTSGCPVQGAMGWCYLVEVICGFCHL